MVKPRLTMNPVIIRFFGRLNDFLPQARRNKRISYLVAGSPAVKDTIEALGVPHVEVGSIRVNKKAARFYYQLKKKDKVEVYPPGNFRNILTPPLKSECKFILDSHLGKLARYLRLLGFNALYKNDYDDKEIALIAGRRGRIVLTRDVGLLKHKRIVRGLWLRSSDPLEQIREVIWRFHLKLKNKPFQICLDCGGKIKKADKAKIARRLPPMAREYYNTFFICSDCRKIYWQGSHYKKLLAVVADIRKKSKAGAC